MALDRTLIKRLLIIGVVVTMLASAGFAFHRWRTRPVPGRMMDEARLTGRVAFSPPDEDYFHKMDGGLDLALAEIQGRNTWMVWSAGNDRFWDWLARQSGGSFDLLKVVGSYNPAKDPKASEAQKEKLKQLYQFRHNNRLAWLGVVNEPCYEEATTPDPRRYGLWLDQRDLACPADPFENAEKYLGVPFGARSMNISPGSAFGAPSGVIGLRLFPNPDFSGEAVAAWDPVRYYNDPSYYESKSLIRPYRVGVTCAFCHAGINPVNLPENLENPFWENISSTVGEHAMRLDRVAMWQGDSSQFAWQVLHAARPGSIDMSLVATDHINNPRAISAFFEMGARMQVASQWGKEKLAGASLDNRQMSTYVAGGPLAAFFEEPATVWTPRMGKDAMDSVGILGAVNRAFPEMGMFSEESMLHYNALIGGKGQLPLNIKEARKNSGYWQVSEELAANVVRFLLRMGDAPTPANPSLDRGAVERERMVFAERCASCHSSKYPNPPADADPGNCSGNYLECWNKYWAWTKSDAYLQGMRKLAAAEDFAKGNSFSTDLRVPLPLVGTNACIALSSNGAAGNVWSAFTSETYQGLPSAGNMTFYHPVTGEKRERPLPAGGPGYLRPPSLAGLWFTAPYLNNNAVGKFVPDVAVDARMAAAREGLEQLLWPEKREKDEVLGDKVPGRIERTTAVSRLRVPGGMLADELSKVLSPAGWFGGKTKDVEIGPIPAGTPVSLLASLNLLHEKAPALLLRMMRELKTEADFAKFVEPLFELSACPDYVVNRGHYFGTGRDGEKALTDAQKKDLIEFLRTL
ncbi:MAG: hypothetical protein ABI806_14735 [Candidatus Solibacter sp.]